ncbi:hypothetical protein B4135_3787 [Caldibacillus debilis]|uniref:Uncharacterized protein n=1 Tax=Caldibacillus debilis TaxID=301148 RepID=A0A150LAU6_9BACI|nr:hypothetical protein B4135_3787 [Caldibacillus debilis]
MAARKTVESRIRKRGWRGTSSSFSFRSKERAGFFGKGFFYNIRRREGFFARAKDSDFGKRHAPVSGPGSFLHRKKIS